ncbi:assimilatory nitrate reductase catalytic subunit [Halobacillus andaensis]|uniref:Assimilatory nitrate reductase catalytic subunit n=1 Tax=Halobacillus andaensis TaxID=1176239 RepID=A0A917B791_HALAA|nr:formate dehydrogenase subunit alpha [Halobacillus andaensis]MBP2005797.1 assimilatory nitrate reductase catalytic subunit [Halobacillus andaensis]GGF25992.1 assimilatory nitrate reductase catalytic subunit [Halobacillus andaensis]
MTDFMVKKGVKNLHREGEKLITTHCSYCGMQCGMHIRVNEKTGKIAGVEPRYDWPVTNGKLCPKGVTAYQQIDHKERIKRPLIKKNGKFVESSWEEALSLIEEKFTETQAKHGKDALSVFGGVSMTNEKCYLVGKYARVALGTRFIDYNGRFCMSSAAGGFIKTFGVDRGSTLPWPELEHSDCFLIAGSNTAECHPTSIQWFWKARDKGAKMIVIDPRETPTARIADVHIDLKPGTDSALANGLLHLIIKEGYVDEKYVAERCNNYKELQESVETFTPEYTAEITGVAVEKIIKAARMYGASKRSVVMFARGVEQQSKGVDNVTLYTSLALLRGQIGKFASGVATFTGQGNGQGGREHGQKADLLPGYRKLTDPEAVKYISNVWGIDPKDMPKPGVSAFEMFDEVQKGNIRAMHVICSNPAVSAPHTEYVWDSFKKLDFMVVNDFFLSETAEFADVVLPATTWAEDEGTTTNLEGRVIHIRKVTEPRHESKPDWMILSEIAKRMGKGKHFQYETPKQIFEELRIATKGGKADYHGITYDRIDREDGVFWPCPEEDHPGTPTMFKERFATPDGKANLPVVAWKEPGETPTKKYPHILTTGRVVYHYLSGTQTRRIDFLMEQCPLPYVEMHPEMASQYNMQEGETIQLTTARSSMKTEVKLTKAIRKDTLFIPYHWGKELAVNQLTNPCLDPISRMPEFKVCAVKIEKIYEQEGIK